MKQFRTSFVVARTWYPDPVIFLKSRLPVWWFRKPKEFLAHRDSLWNSDLDWDSRASVPEFAVIWEDTERQGWWTKNLENKEEKCCVYFTTCLCLQSWNSTLKTVFSRLYRVYLQRFARDCFQKFISIFLCFYILSTVKPYDDPRLSHVSSWGAKKLAQQWDSHETFLKHWLSWQ